MELGWEVQEGRREPGRHSSGRAPQLCLVTQTVLKAVGRHPECLSPGRDCINFVIKNITLVLANLAQRLEPQPAHQRVVGLLGTFYEVSKCVLSLSPLQARPRCAGDP